MLPEARRDQLLLQEVGDELVVYDRERHRVHRLNRSAALVWRHCDGQTSVEELAALLRRELDQPANEEMVWLALDRLQKAALLQDPLERTAEATRVSRRGVMRKLALAGAFSVLLPFVASMIAPTPAMADSSGITDRECQMRTPQNNRPGPDPGCGGDICVCVPGVPDTRYCDNVDGEHCDCTTRPRG